MFNDFIAAIKTGLREYRRLRWVRRYHRSVQTPF